ncbi:MAG: YihA family ribosome biogenesis GTP-binding protein [Proteobacteria bacterium]|nr:YihA family ribosome biogenesis GTP-binding protein [Pseudomonadota bacterium]
MLKNYIINTSEFEYSAPVLTALKPPSDAEIAFVGRSNVGKSSLINLITNHSGLARVSNTPGRTQALNFFQIKFSEKDVDDKVRYSCYFVDLPGFGYAKVARKQKKEWEGLVTSYLFNRPTLRQLILLIDSRREIEEEETMVASWTKRANLTVILTKVDKLNQSEKVKKRKAVSDELKIKEENVIYSSSLLTKKFPIEPIRNKILSKVVK